MVSSTRVFLGCTIFLATLIVLTFSAPPPRVALFAGSTKEGDGYSSLQASLNAVSSVAINSKGDMFIADTMNRKLRKVTASTGLISTLLTGVFVKCVTTSSSDEVYFTAGNQLKKITTAGQVVVLAGTTEFGDSPDGTLANQAMLGTPDQVWLHTNGEIYIADSGNHVVKKIATNGRLYKVAGVNDMSVYNGKSGDNGPAVNATLYIPNGVAVTPSGVIYIADTSNGAIRKVGLNGIITTVAENRQLLAGNYFDYDSFIPYRSAPQHLFALNENEIFFTDLPYRQVKKIDQYGNLTLIAGNGNSQYYPDVAGQLAKDIPLSIVSGLVVSGGHVYFGDQYRVRKVSLSDGILRTAAGNGFRNNFGDNVPSLDASFGGATLKLAVDHSSNVYVLDFDLAVIRQISRGLVKTVAGVGIGGHLGDNIPATQALINEPNNIIFNSKGEMFIGSGSGSIRKVGLEGNITFYLTSSSVYENVGKDSYASESIISSVYDLAFTSQGDLVFMEHNSLRVMNSSQYVKYYTRYDDGILAGAPSIAIYNDEVYIADSGNHVIRKMNLQTKQLTVFAGTLKQSGFSGDSGVATQARLNSPEKIVFTSTGDAFISDSGNNRVRKVSNGIITTVLGNGNTNQYSVVGEVATNTSLAGPIDIAVDPSTGTLYYTENRLVKMLSGVQCFGIDISNSVVCSGNGVCNDTDSCVCNNGYGGSTCSVFKCFGVLATSPIVCSAHGTCGGVDNCKCSGGYLGPRCEQPPPSTTKPRGGALSGSLVVQCSILLIMFSLIVALLFQ